MAFFAEQMEMLTNELLTSRQERNTFVVDVQERSHKLLADAQTFMQAAGREHEAMAVRLRTDLAATSQERLSAVKAQRQQNRKNLQSVRKGQQEMLTENRRQRVQQVAELRTECRTAQKDLANDLRQAAKAWQQMFTVRAKTNGTLQGKVKVTVGATVNPVSTPAKAEEPAHGNHPDKPKEAGHTVDHGRNHATEAKEPAHGNHPDKPKEAGHTVDHGRSHAAESKEPAHSNHHGKAKEPRHSH